MKRSKQYWMKRAFRAESLLRKTMYDSIFGIMSRGGLDVMAENWKASKKKISAIQADIDFMKALNSRFSHAVTNQKIKRAFAEIKKHLTGKTSLFRTFSGDEFCLINEEQEQLEKYIEPIFRAFHAQGIQLTLSANATDNFTTIEKLLDPAMAKIQDAKNQNLRNCFVGNI